MKNKIQNIVISTLKEINEELENEILDNPTKDTKLYGTNGTLDSLALVSLTADLEDSISEEFNIDIILADEKAMSQRTSPFRNVESLTLYIKKLIEEN